VSINPFDGRTEITSEEYTAFLAGQGNPVAAIPMPAPVAMPKLRESAFRDAVVALARYRGWLVYFTWRSDHSPAGFPDLVLVRGRCLIFAELKVKPNTPTTAQREWLTALDQAGAETYVWTPEMWSEIEAILGTPEPAEGEFL
jgi:hypothetical protein